MKDSLWWLWGAVWALFLSWPAVGAFSPSYTGAGKPLPAADSLWRRQERMLGERPFSPPLSLSRNSDTEDNPGTWIDKLGTVVTDSPQRSVRFSLAMVLAGATLGPFLDSYHSLFGVLAYDTPIQLKLWGSSLEYPALITTIWVPALFGLAGFIIGWLYVLGDEYFCDINQPPGTIVSNPAQHLRTPSGPLILYGISFFTFQYWLSGYLQASGVTRFMILVIESILAAAGFSVLDGTWTGLLASTATAVGGPLIEVALLSSSLVAYDGTSYGYHYLDAGETGYFPLWIVPVYFLGGPAVGNLARGIWSILLHDSSRKDLIGTDSAASPTAARPPCRVCHGTRRDSCPNCEGVGTYVAMGGRRIICTSCRGRVFVICRACFDLYNNDPWNVEEIRDVLSQMPD
jgi:hypothetical protein